MLFEMYPREGSPPGRFYCVSVRANTVGVWLFVCRHGNDEIDESELLPDEARSLARALMEAADAAEKGERT